METKRPASYFYLSTTFPTLHPHEKLQTIYKTVLVKTSLSSFTSQDNNGSINLSFNFIHYLNYSSYVRCSRQPIANNVAGQKIIFSDTSIEKLRISLKLIWPLKDSWVWFVLQATLPQTWTYQEIWRTSKREQFQIQYNPTFILPGKFNFLSKDLDQHFSKVDSWCLIIRHIITPPDVHYITCNYFLQTRSF